MPPHIRNHTLPSEDATAPREPFNILAPSEVQLIQIQQAPWFQEIASSLQRASEEKIKTLQKEKEDLHNLAREEIDNLRKEFENYKKKERPLQDQVKKLGDENAILKERLVAFALNDEVFYFFKSIPGLVSEKNNQKSRQIKELEGQLEEQKDDYEQLKEKLKETKQEVSSLKGYNKQLEDDYNRELKRRETEYKNQLQTEAQLFSAEKEEFLAKISKLETENGRLCDQNSLLRTQNDPGLVMNDFSDNTVKSVQDEFQKLKNELNSLVDLVSENHLENDKEVETDMQLSDIIFRQARKMILDSYPEETNIKEVGKSLRDDEKQRKKISKKIRESLKKVIGSTSSTKPIKDSIKGLVLNSLKFYVDMFLIEKNLELVWASNGSQFNPEQYESRNGKQITIINNVFRPALMDTRTRAVYEKGIVDTKERKKK